jgi:hypothetical protein
MNKSSRPTMSGLIMSTQAPTFSRKSANTTAFIIEQLEILIAPDSKYDGIKPDDIKTMADSMRAIFSEELVKKYQIAASLGPNPLVTRMAFTSVHLKKTSRGLLGYTPVGFVVGGAQQELASLMGW